MAAPTLTLIVAIATWGSASGVVLPSSRKGRGTSERRVGASTSKDTPLNDDGGGDSFYLDRHNLQCGMNEAMTQWQLSRGGTSDKIQFKYECATFAHMGACTSKSTALNDGGSGNTLYFDRHDLNCGATQVMTQWHMTRGGTNDKIEFQYECCDLVGMHSCHSTSTGLNDAGEGNSNFLDRHDANCGSGVMTQWRLDRGGTQDKMKIDYKCCDVQAPTPSPTPPPTPPPTAAVTTSTAVGDPHLVNSRGEKFSIFKAGQAEFLRVPYESVTEKADFTLHAKIEPFGETECKKAEYITGLIFAGSRFRGKSLEVNVDLIRPDATIKEMKVLLGGVPVMPLDHAMEVGDNIALNMKNSTDFVLRIDGATVAVNLQYYFLNVEANHFRSLAKKVGGLLGEDDHTEFSTKPAQCERELLSKTDEAPHSFARMTV